jgi:hypothetical protein
MFVSGNMKKESINYHNDVNTNDVDDDMKIHIITINK